MPTAYQEKEVYLGLGLSLKTFNPNKDARTLSNATIQFWSILTLLALARVNERIVKAGYQDDIQCVSTIYDSIYYNCRRDPKIISWLNTVLVEEMSVDFLEDQVVKNTADMEIGPNWAALQELPHNVSEKHLKMLLDIIDTEMYTYTKVDNEQYIATINKKSSPPLNSITELKEWILENKSL